LSASLIAFLVGFFMIYVFVCLLVPDFNTI
jgi:hypothetical protein